MQSGVMASNHIVMLVTVLLAALGLTVVPPVPQEAAAASTTARGLLNRLVVARENTSAYDRDRFKHWIDANGDCQDTRHEVLIAESRVRPSFSSSRCTVVRGTWVSRYDGRTYTRASALDIDHHVALSEAWDSGAHRWTARDRQRFANDLYPPALNAMTPSMNRYHKSDNDPGQWLPPRQRCAYATNWVKVKFRWGLTIDAREKTRLTNVLAGACGSKTVAVPRRAR